MSTSQWRELFIRANLSFIWQKLSEAHFFSLSWLHGHKCVRSQGAAMPKDAKKKNNNKKMNRVSCSYRICIFICIHLYAYAAACMPVETNDMTARIWSIKNHNNNGVVCGGRNSLSEETSDASTNESQVDLYVSNGRVMIYIRSKCTQLPQLLLLLLCIYLWIARAQFRLTLTRHTSFSSCSFLRSFS